MTTVAVIPARFGSTRLPAKALARETGKYLVQHVYERARLAKKIDRVVVATDDQRIVEAVRSFDGEVRMTRGDHQSGTDRVAEIAEQLELDRDDVVINVQGDEPEVNPSTLDTLVDFMDYFQDDYSIGTVAVPFADDGPKEGSGSPLDPNCVKVVIGPRGQAHYFSRSLIPYPRECGGVVDRPSRWLLHLGVYAFRAKTLHEITRSPGVRDRTQKRRENENENDYFRRTFECGDGAAVGREIRQWMKPAELALMESLEQLRWLACGFAIGVVIGNHSSMGIDTPEQYAAFVARWRASEDKRKGEKPAQGVGC